MTRSVWLAFAIALLYLGCGQKSEVDPLFPAKRLSQIHGDGRYAVFTISLPLSERSLDPIDSPVDPNNGVSRVPLLGDAFGLVTRTAFSLGSGLGVGRRRIALNQPIPEIDRDTVKHISIKRVFLHIDERDPHAGPRPGGFFARLRRFISRGDTLNFSFLKELKIRMSMHREADEPQNFRPQLLDDVDMSPREERAPRVDVINYRWASRHRHANLEAMDRMFILYTQHPVRTRNYLNAHPEFSRVIRKMEVVNRTLMVELTGGEVEREIFFALMERQEAEMGDLGITKVDPCKNMVCLDFKPNQENLVPLLVQGNRLRIDAMLDMRRIPPESFQLKGFVEFEIKIDTSF